MVPSTKFDFTFNENIIPLTGQITKMPYKSTVINMMRSLWAAATNLVTYQRKPEKVCS
jgi:hypothetical protein